MTEEQKREAFIREIAKLPYLTDLVRMMEEEIESIKSINMNEFPPPEEESNLDKNFRNIFVFKEQSGYNQLWKEADHKELSRLRLENLLTEQEKLFLRVDELLVIIHDNLQLKLGIIDVLKNLKAFQN